MTMPHGFDPTSLISAEYIASPQSVFDSLIQHGYPVTNVDCVNNDDGSLLEYRVTIRAPQQYNPSFEIEQCRRSQLD